MAADRMLRPWSIWGLAILAGLVIVSAATFELWSARSRLEASTLMEAANLADVGDAQVRAQMRLGLDATRGLAVRALTVDGTRYSDVATLSDSASLVMATHPSVLALELLDASGHVIFASGAAHGLIIPPQNFERDQITVERAPGRSFETVEVGKLLHDPVTQRWYIPIRRSLHNPAGQSAGTILVALDPAKLVDVFEELTSGRHSAVSLQQSDGIIVARYPDHERFVGRSLAGGDIFRLYLPKAPSGAMRLTGVLYHRDLYVAYRKIRGTPFVINLSFDVGESLAPWYRRLWLEAIMVAVALALIGTTALLVARGEARRREAAAAQQGRDIIRGMASVVALIDGDGTIVEVNQALLDLVSFPPQDAIGIKLWDAPWFTPSPEMRARIRSQFEAARGGMPVRADLLFRVDHSRFVVVDTAFRAIAGQGGSGSRVILSGVDVTERRDLEARLSAAQRLEAIGLVSSEIAHDFANYVSVIVGFAELMNDGLAPASPERTYAERILRACANARRMISQLLAYGRPVAAERKAIDLNTVLAEVETTVRPLMPASAAFSVHLARSPVRVSASDAQLSQIFVNLCTNARDALGGSAGSVALSAVVIAPGDPDHPAALDSGDERLAASIRHVGSADADAAYARIVVADSGEGISRESLARIFEPFYTTKPKSRGTGLGLAIVHGAVVALEGVYRIESVPGRGTRFAIYLPVARDEVGAVELAA